MNIASSQLWRHTVTSVNIQDIGRQRHFPNFEAKYLENRERYGKTVQ
jgi:hypothetical protein